MANLGAREIVILAVVFVILLIIWRMSSTAQRLGTGRPAETPLDSSSITTIEGCLARGDKIEAIKAYRQQTGASLAASKRAIDGWQPRGMASG